MIFLALFLLFFGFYLLDKVCDDHFIPTLYKISKKSNLSKEASGATLMAVGSSSPELFISLMAILKPGGHESIGMGTIVGSALFNLLFVVGVSLFVGKNTRLHAHIVFRDVVFYSFSIALLLFFFWDGIILLWEAALLLFLYGIYVFLVIFWKKFFPVHFHFFQQGEEVVGLSWRKIHHILQNDVESKFEALWEKKSFFFFLEYYTERVLSFFFFFRQNLFLYFLNGILIIILLTWGIVDLAIFVSASLGIPEALLAITVLAVGASLPDFLTSYIVSKQGNPQMGVENAVGSNIFDVLFGLGFPWVLFLLFFVGEVFVQKNDVLVPTLLLLGSIFLFFFVCFFSRWNVSRWGGGLLIFAYVLFFLWTIAQYFFPFLGF